MANMEKIAAVMTEEFIAANKDLDNLDAIYEAVKRADCSIDRESFDAFADMVSDKLHEAETGEIDEASLEDVSGGSPTAVLGLLLSTLQALYKFGEKMGEAMYYKKNPRR